MNGGPYVMTPEEVAASEAKKKTKKTGCPLCGERTGQLHKPSCYLGGSVTA